MVVVWLVVRSGPSAYFMGVSGDLRPSKIFRYSKILLAKTFSFSNEVFNTLLWGNRDINTLRVLIAHRS